MHANFRIIDKSQRCVIIKDIGPWNQFLTITNDVEWVVEKLFKDRDIFNGQRLFYIDSDGYFDEIVIEDGKFSSFSPIRRTGD